MEQLDGRTAVVTGAASGIGRALALRLAAEGMAVVLADVEEEPLAAVAAEIQASGSRVAAVPTDVSDAAAVEALAEEVWRAFGGAHLVCNNAGVFQGGLLWERTLEDWEWVLGVNLFGIVHGIRSFVPRLIEQGGPAHVVNTSSMAGLITMPYSGPYVASKFAAYALSECLAQDLRTIGAPIGVSVLCPSLIATDIGASRRNRPARLAVAPTDSTEFIDQALLDATREGIRPEEAADAVVEGVRADRFLIPTRESFSHQISDHTEALLRRELPEMPVID